MKELIVIEVSIGELLPVDGFNPFRDYLPNLKLAKEWNCLDQVIDLLGDFDPFNISSDLLMIGEYELSINLFFKFYGRVIKKKLSDDERERRNKKIQYCLSQYVTYYTKKGDYLKAAEVALLDSQKEIAAELFKKARAGQEEEDLEDVSGLGIENSISAEETDVQKGENEQDETSKCPTCGEIVGDDAEICPGCNNVLNLVLCVCGEKIKPQWKKCPACHRIIEQPSSPGEAS
jgi:RNA polymerase subunit RPABC4/transcription elongation factor Spt4